MSYRKSNVRDHLYILRKKKEKQRNIEFKVILDSSLKNCLYKLERFIYFIRRYLPKDETMVTNMLVSLSEAVTNSLIHGNKFEHSKLIHLSASITDKSVNYTIEDEGNGFDFESLECTDPASSGSEARGILIMKYLSDSLKYANGGRKLQLIFKKE